MAQSQSELIAKLEVLASKVDAYTTDCANELAAAVAEAKAAWDKDEQAALDKFEEIGGKLKIFSPSGN